MAPDPTPFNFWFQVPYKSSRVYSCIALGTDAEQIDDLNKPFTFQEGDFDFVHSRCVVPGLDRARWDTYVRDCFR